MFHRRYPTKLSRKDQAEQMKKVTEMAKLVPSLRNVDSSAPPASPVKVQLT